MRSKKETVKIHLTVLRAKWQKQFDFWYFMLVHIQYNNQYMSTKAAELLRALNSQVQHHSTDQNLPPVPEEKNEKEGEHHNDADSPQLNSQILANNQRIGANPFNSDLKFQQSKETPEWLSEMLEKQIGSIVNESIFEKIQSIMSQSQKNTYDAFTKGSQQYLQVLLDHTKSRNQNSINVVSSMLLARLGKVENQLEKGNIIVHHQRNINNRKQLEYLQQLDLERMIKIKDGQLRSKLDILNEKMENFEKVGSADPLLQEKKGEEEIQKRLVQSMDYNNYSLDSEKTKIAKDYVRYMQQQKRLIDNRKKERKARYKLQQDERQSQLKEAQEMRDMAKKQQILQKIEMRRRKRQEEEKEQQIHEQQVQKLLAEYHKKLPIFKIKQKEFEEKILKPEQKYREEKLNEIRQNRRSLSFNEIKTHQQKYLNKLQTEKVKREQQFKLIIKSRKSEDKSHPYYKGSAHKRIYQMTKQQKLRSYSMREANKMKIHRMKQYGDVIHKNYKPTVDEDKKKQLIKFIEDDLMRKKHARKLFKQIVDQSTQEVRFQQYYEEIPKKDLYKEGNRHFQQAKKHMKRKEKTTADKLEQLEGISNESAVKIKLLSPTSPQDEKKNKSVWELRAKHLQQIANGEVVDAKNFQFVKKNIQNLDSKAAQKQQLMNKVDLSMEEHIKEKGMLDNYYLESIKQKMKLLE